MRFDLTALFANATNLVRVPIFLAALLIVRGVPALVYRSLATRTRTLAAALLPATSLSFLIVAGQIGVQLDILRPAVYAALVAAGLLSVLLFPAAARRCSAPGRNSREMSARLRGESAAAPHAEPTLGPHRGTVVSSR